MSSLDIRKKVSSERLVGTHERLRADHIQMMEMLQRTQDSNTRLEDELEKLRAQLGSDGEQADTTKVDEGALQGEVLALTDRVKELELENKCMMKLHEGKIENLQNHSKIITGRYENIKAEKDLLLEKLATMSSSGDGAKSIASSHSIVRPLLASVRDFNKMMREDIGGLRAEVTTHTTGLTDLLEDWKMRWIKRQTASVGSVSTKKAARKPGRILSDGDEGGSEALGMGGSSSTGALSLSGKAKEPGTQKQTEDLRRKLAASSAECQKLSGANSVLGQEVSGLKTEIERLGQLLHAAQANAQTLAPTAPPAAEKISEAHQGQGEFSFEAFIKLKKENKELKLEVLKLSTPHPNPKLNRVSSKAK